MKVVKSVSDIRVGDLVKYMSPVLCRYSYGRVLHIGDAFGTHAKDAVWSDWQSDEKSASESMRVFNPKSRNGLTYVSISESEMVLVSDKRVDRFEAITEEFP